MSHFNMFLRQMKVTKKDSEFGGCAFQFLYSGIYLLSEKQREIKFKCVRVLRLNANVLFQGGKQCCLKTT